jgi:hypothetical protein
MREESEGSLSVGDSIQGFFKQFESRLFSLFSLFSDRCNL